MWGLAQAIRAAFRIEVMNTAAAYGVEGDPNDVCSILTQLRLVKTAQQRKDIIFDYNQHFKNLKSLRDHSRREALPHRIGSFQQTQHGFFRQDLQGVGSDHSRRDALPHRGGSFHQTRHGFFEVHTCRAGLNYLS